MTALILETPAAGARYRKRSTGRTWLVSRICDSGLISVVEDFYGSDCERRGYITDVELGSEYEPVP